ncbi:hypothetical protein GCM10023205_82560 [Yinghuangia aomiensis]|uniref:Uncharacterized protein n=1 Tax=Yinghuangia aomiensis TaxID=676205 RepID=A0ABP9IFM4_9ACTN
MWDTSGLRCSVGHFTAVVHIARSADNAAPMSKPSRSSDVSTTIPPHRGLRAAVRVHRLDL